MSLPFPLSERHKYYCRKNWKKRGMKIDPDDFDYVYNEYIHATKCELCNKKFTKSIDRHLDHNHETGDVRNIVCNKCNRYRQDYKKRKTNTGEYYISRIKNKEYKTGYGFHIRIVRDGKYVIRTSRTTLEDAIICRDEFIKNNPEIYT